MAEGVLRAAGRGRVVVLVAGTALRAPGAERLVVRAARGGAGVTGAGQPAGRPRPRPRDGRAGAGARRAGGDGGLLAAAVRGQRGLHARGGGARARVRRGGRGRARAAGGRRRRRRAAGRARLLTDPAQAAAFVARDRRRLPGGRRGQRARRAAARARARWTGRAWRRSGARSTCRSRCTAAPGSTPRSCAARCARGSPRSTSTRRCAAPIWRRRRPGLQELGPAGDLVALHARQAGAVEAVARSTLDAVGLAENSDLVGRL